MNLLSLLNRKAYEKANALVQRSYDQQTQANNNNDDNDDVDVTTLWATIFDSLYVNESHAIGGLTKDTLEWLFDNGLGPNDQQKPILIPYLCLNNATTCQKEAVIYLIEQGYPIFDMDCVFKYIHNNRGFCRKNRREIAEIVRELYQNTCSVTDDKTIFCSIAYHLLDKRKITKRGSRRSSPPSQNQCE